MAPHVLEMMFNVEDLALSFSESSSGLKYFDGVYFIPPFTSQNDVTDVVWMDYEGYVGKGEKKFADFEYIYNPVDIINMKGRKYHVFRHNINKFREKNYQIEYREGSKDDIHEIGEKWLIGQHRTKKDMPVESWIFFAEDFLNGKVLYLDGEPVAFNLWDIGLKYVHFMVNCSDPDIEFLNEYSRYLFYLDISTRYPNMLVNDGGTLGSEGLRRYKNKLNPVAIRSRYSWGLNNE